MITIADILSDPDIFVLEHPLIEAAIAEQGRKRREVAAGRCCEVASEPIPAPYKGAAECARWSDLVTPKQLVAMRRIASTKGINWETVSVEMFGKKPEALTKRQASGLIEELKKRKRA